MSVTRKLLQLLLFGVLTCLIHAQEPSTWQVIQEQIWNVNCIGCHIDGTTFAEQSDLILTEDAAYEELINVVPNNSTAAEDGLVRVGTEGLLSLYNSFLWEKINAPEQEHFYSEHPHYGAIMPLGLPVLTHGELNFIEEWILGGAPEEGVVADTTLLDDTTRYEPPEFVPLAPPEFGLQLQLGPFDVPPNYEREFLYWVPLDSLEFIYIKRFEIMMRPGSHHFIAYTFRNDIPPWLLPEPFVYRDLRDEFGNYIDANLIQMLYHSFGVGTQWPQLNYHFPPGTALKLNVSRGLDLNSHYINQSDTTYQGEVYLNIHYAEPDEVEAIAHTLALNNRDFILPPHDTTTVTRTYWIDEVYGQPINVFQLFSHAHEHMLDFQVYIIGGEQDGELVYFSNDWQHPPILELDPPLYLDTDQGLELVATYDNWTDEPIEFGLLGSDEMMILFGYYYTDEESSVEINPALPDVLTLHPVYPNPFNARTEIRFQLPSQRKVELTIHDLLGRQVKSLTQDVLPAGEHAAFWGGRDEENQMVSSGIYIIRLESGEQRVVRKILFLK